MTEEKVSMKEKLCYGVGDIFAGGSFLLVALLFLKFLTDVVGLSPGMASLVIMGGKIWDAVSDPLMGNISDRTKSRFGRRRIYFLAGIFPILFSFSGLWMSFGFESEISTFIYYLVFYMLFSTAFTLVQVPYVALMPEITTSYKERASVAGVRLMFSAVSAILAGMLPMMIIKQFPADPGLQFSKMGFMVMGLIFGVFYALPWIIVFFGTKERVLGKTESTTKNPFKDLETLLKNRSFRHHAGLFIFSQTAVDILSALFIYFMTTYLDKLNHFSFVMGTLLIVPLFTLPIYTKIAKRFQKTTPMHFGMIIWAIAMVSTLLVTKENWYLIYVVAAFCGIGTSASVFVPWTILPEVTDVDEIISGRRREGIYGGIATFLRKIAGGLGIAIVGVFLEVIGYMTPQELASAGLVSQSSDAIWGLRLMVAIVPTVLILIAFVFSLWYKVDERRHTILMKEINRLKKGGSKGDVDSETLDVCEELTGYKYEQLWE